MWKIKALDLDFSEIKQKNHFLTNKTLCDMEKFTSLFKYPSLEKKGTQTYPEDLREV